MYEAPGPLQYITLSFMILITFYLTFLYIKSKAFHTYSCYNIIIMSIVVFIGGILNIFVPKIRDSSAIKFIWSFLKDIFNKLIISILTMQVIILYIGIIKTELYYSKEKLIFILGIIACVSVCLLIGIIFNAIKFCGGEYRDYFDDYKKALDNPNLGCTDLKERFYSIMIIELVFCFVLLVINVFCLTIVLSFICRKNKEAKEGLIEDLGYKSQLIRFIFIFILNIIVIVVSCTFLVFDVFDEVTNQSIYLGACLLIDFCFSINETVYKETLRLFKCKKINEKEEELKGKNTYNELEEINDVDDDN